MVLAPCLLTVQDGAALRAGDVLSQGFAGRALEHCHPSQGQQNLLGKVKSDVISCAGCVWVCGSGQHDNTGAWLLWGCCKGVHILVLLYVSQAEVQVF